MTNWALRWTFSYNWTSSPISGTTWTHTYATEGTYSVNVTCYNNISVQSVVVPQYIQAPIVNLRLRKNGALVVSIPSYYTPLPPFVSLSVCCIHYVATTNCHTSENMTLNGPEKYQKIRNTRCVAMPRLMAARWVGQNSDPIFRRFWTKVYRIKFGCVGVPVVYNAVFRLTISCCIPEIFTIKSRVVRTRAEILTFFDRRISGEGPSKFLTEIYKCGSPSNMWQSLVTIDRATSEIRRRKTE